MNILVTGATGFLGTALCSRLEAGGHRVTKVHSKNCDLIRRDSLPALDHPSYDRIFHLAAWTQAGDFCIHHPGEQWVINQQINTNVIEWWWKSQPQAKLICMGTSCAYAPDMELKEENYLVGTPIESLFTYAMTKRMLYAGLLALNRQFGLKYLCLVPSTLYGPGYHTDGRQMHFIFDLIRKILRGKLYGEPVVLWGDGHQRRELVFIDDFVDIMIKLTGQEENRLINIGAGEEFTIRRFAEIICVKAGYDVSRIRYDASRYVGAKSKCLDVTLLKNLLPGIELTPLEYGIGKTVEWFTKAMK
ncbi:MAG: NAD-dependent epimerase/dehydratase family protein [Deltaproteobacteria bacterium]|nr:NAD-dependent epimerase/dehydratase family protein [Deltaproteobacteria bacterium]